MSPVKRKSSEPKVKPLRMNKYPVKTEAQNGLEEPLTYTFLQFGILRQCQSDF